MRGRDFRACEHIESSEEHCASDGDGLGGKLLGLDGIRLIAVVEAEPTMRCPNV